MSRGTTRTEMRGLPGGPGLLVLAGSATRPGRPLKIQDGNKQMGFMGCIAMHSDFFGVKRKLHWCISRTNATKPGRYGIPPTARFPLATAVAVGPGNGSRGAPAPATRRWGHGRAQWHSGIQACCLAPRALSRSLSAPLCLDRCCSRDTFRIASEASNAHTIALASISTVPSRCGAAASTSSATRALG